MKVLVVESVVVRRHGHLLDEADVGTPSDVTLSDGTVVEQPFGHWRPGRLVAWDPVAKTIHRLDDFPGIRDEFLLNDHEPGEHDYEL